MSREISWKFMLVVVVIVLLLWAGFGFGSWWLYPRAEDAAALGNTFGIAESLFTGLAFAGVIIAILLQRNELSLTRDVLGKQAEALEKSQEAHEKQALYSEASAIISALGAAISASDHMLNVYRSDSKEYKHVERKRAEYLSKLEQALLVLEHVEVESE